MSVLPQNRRQAIFQTGTTLISFGLFVYFAFHLMHGDMGYFAQRDVDQKLVQLQADYDRFHAEREQLENRVKRLRPASLDLDMLDERARAVLNFAAPEEKVIPETAQ